MAEQYPNGPDASSLDPVFNKCIAKAHTFEEIPYDGKAPPRFRSYPRSQVEIVQSRCVGTEHEYGCGKEKYELWSWVTGDTIDVSYRSPQGFAMPRGGRKAAKVEYLRQTRAHPEKRASKARRAPAKKAKAA